MKKFLFLGLVALMAAGISSCSDDAVVEQLGNTTKPLDSDQSFFVNISVNGAGADTRAVGDYTYNPENDPKFDDGEEEYNENGIQSIYFVFYDENGSRVSTTQVRKDNANESAGRNDSEYHIYSGVVQIDVKHGSLPPTYVMAFINPITATNFEINPEFATLKSLQRVTRPRIIDDNNYFAMSKSVYYGYDRTKPADAQVLERIIATPLEKGQLFSTAEEAQNALEKNANASIVDIYVERYAVKVNFSLKEEIADGSTLTLKDEEGYTLKFVPEYWAVNAYESETYTTKSFFTMNESTGEVNYDRILSYQDMSTALGGGWKWNNPTFHRCYWAQSPAYYAKKYPRVADDILDKETNEDFTGYALGYYSYNEMVENAKNPSLISKARNLKDDSRPIYARENTVSGAALHEAAEDDFASPKAAIPSVVMVGHYEIKPADSGDDAYTTPANFYVMGNATNGYTLFQSENAMRNYFVKTTIPFATNQSGTGTFFDYTYSHTGANQTDPFTNADYRGYFIIKHPDAAVRGSLANEDKENTDALIIDSRFVTIQISKAYLYLHSEDLPLYAYYNGRYTKVTEANVDDINKQMLFTAGTVQGFNQGKAYFTIPIKHLGFYRNGNENAGKNANDKNFNWEKVMSGDFGLVRNHIYSIVVDNITGLGNGIPNPDDPIVPPTDPEEYFIGARLIILNWAVVPTQHVTL